MTLSETRRAYGHALFWFTAANALLAFLNAYGYIISASLAVGSVGWLFAVVALWGQVALVCVLAGILFAAVAGVGPGYALPRWLAPPLFALLHLLLLVDKQIYVLFRFHWNGLVWNVITTPGGWESMHVSTADFARFLTVALLIVAAEYAGFTALLGRYRRRVPRPGGLLQRWALAAGFVLASVAADHLVYAVSDLKSFREVTRSAKVVPFYQPLTVKKLAQRFGWSEADREAEVRVGDRSASFLDYPKAALTGAAPAKLYNVVWVVIDGWRSDAMTAEGTPNIFALAKRSQVFESHLSGGNATRFGIFSMFYGLYGTYWHNFLNESRGPVLIERMKTLGYKFKILSSTSLTFPEFRRTAFAHVPEAIDDALPGASAVEKDAALVAGFSGFLDGLKPEDRFFGFLFGDSTHAGYYFPDSSAHFKPFEPGLEYLKLGSKTDPKMPHNRYLNAVYYSDQLVGKLVKDLERRGRMKDTILLVTGDHGEEFHEHGLWGHNGNFSKEEIQVPLILYIPGREPKHYAYATSHHDLAPTFLDLLGVKNPPSDYSFGTSLFKAGDRRYAVNCSWDQCALIAPDATFVFATESHGVGGMEIYDPSYKEVQDRKSALNAHAADLAHLLGETSLFLKK